MHRIRSASRFALVVFLVAAPVLQVQAEDTKPAYTVHYGLSRAMFRDVNENDARAAIVAYSKKLGDEYGIEATPFILDGHDEIVRALETKAVDMVGLNAEEFLELEREELEGPFLFSKPSHGIFEEYVLVAREDGPVRSVEDLRGRSLIVSNTLQGHLAPMWLEVLFRDHGLDSPQTTLERLAAASKPAQVVLPVFFKKADAAVLTSSTWKVMGELNPQVSEQLRVIATSPPVVVGLSCFRKGASPALKQRILEVAAKSKSEPSFQQVMALFRGGEVIEASLSLLDSTRALMARYRQVTSEARPGKGLPPAPAANRPAAAVGERVDRPRHGN